MKRKYLVALIAILMALFIGAIFTLASNGKIPEPSRQGKDIPNDVVWDEEKGVYKLSENTDVNENSLEVAAVPVKLFEEQDAWIEKNKDSSDPLDQAITKWIKNRKLNAHKSYYSSDEDETFKEITNLGIKYLPEMTDRIQEDDGVQTGVLMDAVSKITKVESLKKIDLSTEGKKQWNSNYENALKKASFVVQNFSDKDSFENGLKECGIFVAPYIAEKESHGDNSLSAMFDTKNISDDELKVLKYMVEKQLD